MDSVAPGPRSPPSCGWDRGGGALGRLRAGSTATVRATGQRWAGWLVVRRRGGMTVAPLRHDRGHRLLVELAAREHPQRVERAVDNALAASLLTTDALALVVSELCSSGRKGSGLLRRISEELVPGDVPPASELEARFRDLCRSAGLPEPDRQLEAGGDDWVGRVDVVFREARLITSSSSSTADGGMTAPDDVTPTSCGPTDWWPPDGASSMCAGAT